MIGAPASSLFPMVHPSQQKPHYPGRKPLPTIIFARNGKVRSFKVRLWVAVPLLCLIGLCLTAYTGAGLYLVYRDDLLGSALVRQVEMQYSYEDRIAALRAELDRVTSRHLVQTASVEDQIGVLLERQATIEQRQATLAGLVEHARESGIGIATAGIPESAVRMPRARPDIAVASAASAAAGEPAAPLAFADEPETDDIITGTLLRPTEPAEEPGGELQLRPMLMDVQSSLDDAQSVQTEALQALSAAAEAEAERISAVVAPLNVKLEDLLEDEPQGGPYVPATGLHFVEQAALLRRSLDEVAGLRRAAEALPLGQPVAATRVSSRFGYRMDPFLKRAALHAGLDLVAPAGTEVRAAAAGTVVSAGWRGGYGQLVEIRHASGTSTRYGHLSAILVTEGQQVAVGDRIGRVGSTGRSTGPHLHYETRRGDEAVNPAPFLAAGKALQAGRND